MAYILLVDDDVAFVDATSQLLTLLGHKVDSAETVLSARALLAKNHYSRVFLDLMLPDGSGFQLLEHISVEKTAVTIITGHPSIKTQIMNLYGLNVNYLIKPINLAQLKRLFEADDNKETKRKSRQHFSALIGESSVMQDLYVLIERVATSNANVLLMGESGSGKEVVANAIHHASKRQGKFVAANCGAFSNELIGSELFGHEKGAFTGAIARRTGLFEEAEQGTLFLDEITEMPLSLQPNLLRTLETKSLSRVGSTTPIAIDCRIISATNRSESSIVESNCLREDIYYRLAVFPIHIPPLRERLDDIPLLTDSFLEFLNRENGTDFCISDSDMAILQNYDWPGNIRELRHMIHRAYIMTPPDAEFLLLPENICSPFSRHNENKAQTTLAGRSIEDVEHQLIMETLQKFNNNKTRAAEVLGVSVKTLYNRLGAYETSKENAV